MSTETTQTTNTPAATATAVVVGVDGSSGSREALLWAIDEARLRSLPLRVVHAWTFGYIGGIAGYWGGPFAAYGAIEGNLAELRKAAAALLDCEVADAAGQLAGVTVERKVVEGLAGEALVDSAQPGDILVVGSRGHGGFAGVLLGSVSQQCVNHARCPVVVVRPAKTVAQKTDLACEELTRA
jgi:nucleotide-binding universal stress UspA family protein